jgi:chromosomal replication initiator protein
MNPYIIPGIKRSTLSDRQLATLKPNKRMVVEEILSTVARFYGITIESIKSHKRKREIVEARHAFCYLARQFSTTPLKDIGQLIGGKDHTTVMHANQQVKAHMDVEPEYRKNILALTDMLQDKIYGGTIASPTRD